MKILRQHSALMDICILIVNFEVAHKLKGILSFQTATENKDTSPKNQFTAQYLRKDLESNNAMTIGEEPKTLVIKGVSAHLQLLPLNRRRWLACLSHHIRHD